MSSQSQPQSQSLPRSSSLASVAHSSMSMSTVQAAPQPQIVHPREWAVPSYLREARASSLFHAGGSSTTAGSSATPLASASSGSGSYLERLQARIDAGAHSQRIPLPSRLDPKQCCKRLNIISDTRVQFLPERDEQGREKLNRQDPDKDAASVRADHPIPAQTGVYYYEMQVISRGQKGYIGIGFSTRKVDLERLPGWDAESYGYHGDDGKAFACSGTGQAYGPRFSSGDVVGCGLDFIAKKAFFVKNGRWLGYVFDLRSALHDPSTGVPDPALAGEPATESLPANMASRRERERERERRARETAGPLKFYPTFGLQTVGENVKINFGQEPFRFDIESFVKRRRQEITQDVLAWSLPSTLFDCLASPKTLPLAKPGRADEASSALGIGSSKSVVLDPRLAGTLEALVSGYLNHHGFAETSRAFRRQREAEKENWADLLRPKPVASTSALPVDEEDGEESQSAAAAKAKRKDGKKSKSKLAGEGKSKAGKKDKGVVGSGSELVKTMGSAVRTTLDSGERSDVDVVHSEHEQSGARVDGEDAQAAVKDDLMMSDVAALAPAAQLQETEAIDAEEAELEDTARRQTICSAIAEGKIDAATAELEEWYPSVLHPGNNTSSMSGTMPSPVSRRSVTAGRSSEEGMDLLFRLRCRKFVELVLASANQPASVEEDDENMDEDSEMGDDDEEDDDDQQVASALIASHSRTGSPVRPAPSASACEKGKSRETEADESAVEDVLSYGARLNALYPRTLTTPATRAYLNTVFSLVAFNDPASQPGEVGALCAQDRRQELADAVNEAMLKAKGRESMSRLEKAYRQAHACTNILGEVFGDARAALLGDVLV